MPEGVQAGAEHTGQVCASTLGVAPSSRPLPAAATHAVRGRRRRAGPGTPARLASAPGFAPGIRARSRRRFMKRDRSLLDQDFQIPYLRRILHERWVRPPAVRGILRRGADVRRIWPESKRRRRECSGPVWAVGEVSDVAGVEQVVVRCRGRGIGNHRGEGSALWAPDHPPAAGESTLGLGPGSGTHRPRGSPMCRATAVGQSANRTINNRACAQ